MGGSRRRREVQAWEVALLARGFAVVYGPDAGLAAESRLYAGRAEERRLLQAVVKTLSRSEFAQT